MPMLLDAVWHLLHHPQTGGIQLFFRSTVLSLHEILAI